MEMLCTDRAATALGVPSGRGAGGRQEALQLRDYREGDPQVP